MGKKLMISGGQQWIYGVELTVTVSPELVRISVCAANGMQPAVHVCVKGCV